MFLLFDLYRREKGQLPMFSTYNSFYCSCLDAHQPPTLNPTTCGFNFPFLLSYISISFSIITTFVSSLLHTLIISIYISHIFIHIILANGATTMTQYLSSNLNGKHITYNFLLTFMIKIINSFNNNQINLK